MMKARIPKSFFFAVWPVFVLVMGTQPAARAQAKRGPLDLNLPTLIAGRLVSYGPQRGFSYMEFRANGTYDAAYNAEGFSWQDSGNFVIRDGRVVLNPTKCERGRRITPCAAVSLGPAVCVTVYDLASLYYTHSISCRSARNGNVYGTMPPRNDYIVSFPASQVPAGTARTYKGIRLVTTGLLAGKTTKGTQIRNIPSADAPTVPYYSQFSGNDTAGKSFVPPGTDVLIIARTAERDRIKNSDEYWYLVTIGITTDIWVYGDGVEPRN